MTLKGADHIPLGKKPKHEDALPITKKAVRHLIACGAAEDWSEREDKIPEDYKEVFWICDRLGLLQGAVFVGKETKKLYAFIGRTSNFLRHLKW